MKDNPFIHSLVIQMNMIEPINTYELSDGFIIPKIQRLDGVRAVKLFRTPEQIELIAGLSPSATKLLMYIMLTITPRLDYVTINLNRFIKLNHVLRNCFYTSSRELIRYGIISKMEGKKLSFWINPAYFYCGSRPQKWPSKVVRIERKPSKTAD